MRLHMVWGYQILLLVAHVVSHRAYRAPISMFGTPYHGIFWRRCVEVSFVKEMWIVIAKVLVASLNYSDEECTKALMN